MGKPFSVGATPGAADLNNLVGVYDRVTTAVDVVNLNTEQTLYSKTITGGHLSTNRSLELLISGDFLNNSGAGETLTVRVKYGGTTMWGDVSDSITASATRRDFKVFLQVANLGATNSQIASGWVSISPSTAGSIAGIGDISTSTTNIQNSPFDGTAAVDSTADQTLAVTVQHSVANANISCRLKYARLLLL